MKHMHAHSTQKKKVIDNTFFLLLSGGLVSFNKAYK